ncbi:hypothetical protein XENTR_v10003286 [Xenopus tropicalis]|uniref:long-chain-fatty-acid--CoA ligase n=1 Tax=Xenopus tropicalis TaxID=8364 RepID=A0A803JUQ2_XENTR|nr:long-chain-fatty-acid--CoA ligase ACSBG2 [Xenopus tropicalis]KAE8637037.1 hypothetical protein XENTR_v10003286 [Xenopus tropicalis]
MNLMPQRQERTESFAIFSDFNDNRNLIVEAKYEDPLQEDTSEACNVASQGPTSSLYNHSKEGKDQMEGAVFQRSQLQATEEGTGVTHMVMCNFAGISTEPEATTDQLQVLSSEAPQLEHEATTAQRREVSQETTYSFINITTESKMPGEQLEVFTSAVRHPENDSTMKEPKGKNIAQPKKVTVERHQKSPSKVTSEEDADLSHERTCNCNDVCKNTEWNNQPKEPPKQMAAGLNVRYQDEYRPTLEVTVEESADMSNNQYCTAGTTFESQKENIQYVTGNKGDINQHSEWEAIAVLPGAVKLNVREGPREDKNKNGINQPDLGNPQEKSEKEKEDDSDPLSASEEPHPGSVEGTNKEPEQHEELARLTVWGEVEGKLQYLAKEVEQKEPKGRKVHVTMREGAKVASQVPHAALAERARAYCTGPSYHGCSGNALPLAPAQSLWAVQRDGAVRLRMEPTGAGSEPPLTVAQLMAEAVRRFGQQVALCVRKAEEWHRVTYLQYEQQCRAVSKGLIRVGLRRFHGVVILGKNSPEWFIAEIGSIMAGGLAVVIDPLCTASFLLDVAQNTEAQVILLQDHRQLRKVLQVQRKLPQVKAIVQWEGGKESPHPRLYTWEELILLGMEVPDSKLDDVIASQKPNQCCSVFYAKDDPRGVMLSHDNLTWVSQTTCKHLSLGKHDVVISYLPLNQVAAQLFDLWIPLCSGGTTYFAEADALRKSLLRTLREVRPTRFLGFPCFWEKIQTRWMTLEEKAKLFPRKIMGWGRGVGLTNYQKEGAGAAPWGFSLAQRLVFHPARVALGLDRCSLCYVGTVPITQGTMEYYGSLGLTLLNVYGRNESSGVHSLAMNNAWRTKSSGLEILGCRTHIKEPLRQGATGELCLWGRHVFMGYLGMEKETQAALDGEGWLLTSDLGTRDPSGFLYVTEWGAGPYERPVLLEEPQQRWSSEGLYMEI